MTAPAGSPPSGRPSAATPPPSAEGPDGRGEPVDAAGRLHVLDALRGFALFGILQANVLTFSGLFFLAMVGDVDPSPLDTAVGFVIEALVHGKFYSLFSLLFGIGFCLFLQRAEANGRATLPLFRRRLWLLLGIGVLHATLMWSGDILMLYALVGFALVPFHRLRSRTVLAWAAGLLALPVLAYALMWGAGMADPLGPPAVDPADAAPAAGGGFDPIAFMIAGFRGGYLDVLQANLVQLAGRWVDLLVTLRPAKVLGMFLLGLWIGRHGVARDLDAHAPLIRRVASWGLGLGLPLNVAAAWLAADATPYLPGSPAGMAEVLIAAIGVPLLALGYAAGIALLVRSPATSRVPMALAPVGRLALTNYLLQSLACMFVFYGFGLGLYGQVGTATAAGIALLIFAVQLLLSRWWLRHYRYGPAEWAWRRLTYRVPVALKRTAAA
ncbi:DUF418 domain-containing protein [Lysobacter sp. A3-1-A15]|uniref:DUF418 domain-containing protein n=1 Tax=Novilysobacter viscosus TaxID=3098602 RepID=UPI002EDA0CB0